MSDNKDKPQDQTISVEGFHAFGNPIDNTDAPIKHRKKQLPVKYYSRKIENDIGEGFEDLIQITAVTVQYGISARVALPHKDVGSAYKAVNIILYDKLAAEGYHVDNIELVEVDAVENKENK